MGAHPGELSLIDGDGGGRLEQVELAFIIGTVHFINGLFMLEDDPEADVAALVRKYRRALSLAGTGIAMGYFFNFVQPIVRAIDGGKKRSPGCSQNSGV